MKSKLFAMAALAALIASCSPKTVATPTTPKQPETPKIADAMNPPAENVAKGKELYTNSCGRCHKLFDPKSQTAQDWEPILKRMQKKARLEDTDMALIHDYIFSELK